MYEAFAGRKVSHLLFHLLSSDDAELWIGASPDGLIGTNAADIDGELGVVLDRDIKELDPIELAVLRIGVYELLKRIDVPYRVVINEAIEMAKSFGATDGHKYVNGILDKLAPRLRKAEVSAARKGR